MTKEQFKQEKKLARNRGVGGATFAKVGLVGAIAISIVLLIILIVFSFKYW